MLPVLLLSRGRPSFLFNLMTALDGAPDGDEALDGLCTLSNTEVLPPLSKTERTFSIVET